MIAIPDTFLQTQIPAPQISWKQASTVTVCPGTNVNKKEVVTTSFL